MSEEKKTQTHALATVPRAGAGMVLRTVDDHKQFAMAAWAAGVLEDGDKTRAVGIALVKMQYGAEVGLGPMSAIAGVHLIKGKPSLGAGIVASRIQAHPLFRFRQLEQTATSCTLRFWEREAEGAAWEHVGDSTYTLADAKLAGLEGNANWKKHPRSMLFARALTDGARRFCPVVFSGSVYTPEELSDGQVLEADFAPVPEAEPPSGGGAVSGARGADTALEAELHEDIAGEQGALEQGAADEPPPAASPDAPSRQAIDRMRALLAEAKKMKRTGKIIAALEADIIAAEERELSAAGAGALIAKVKAALESLGWKEPAEWGAARKERQAAKRAEKKAADAGAQNTHLWGQAAAMRTRCKEAGVELPEQLATLWKVKDGAFDKVPEETVLAAIAAGQAALDRAEADNDPGEPPMPPTQDEAIAELRKLAESPHADDGMREAIDEAINREPVSLDELRDLLGTVRKYIDDKAEADERLF